MKDRYLRFTGLLIDITRKINRATAEALSVFGAKRSYAYPVYLIYKNGPLTAARLCRLCGEDKANVSRTLKSLEEDFLVVKERHGQSRVRFMLTEDGIKLGKYLCDRVSDAVDAVASGISEEDLEAMYRSLEMMNDNLSGLLGESDV